MNKKALLPVCLLMTCLLLSSAVLAAAAESADQSSLFFSGYRWLMPYSALFSSAGMDDCVGVATETGLVWAVERENGFLRIVYADEDGQGGEAYVEESRTSRAVRIDIAGWLSETGKEQVSVSQQSVAPLAVARLVRGEAAAAEPAEPEGLKILSQPDNQRVKPGEQASFSVSAKNAVSWQWQYSKDGGKNWDDLRNTEFWIGCKKDTLTFAAGEQHNGFLFRCVVSDKTESLESEAALLSIIGKVVAFDEKPADRLAAPGSTVSFRASLQGADKYRWQYSKDNGLTWGDLSNGDFWQGNHTDTLTFAAEQKHDGFLFRCGVTYEGETVYSESARLTVADYADALPVLRAQSGDVTVREGETVTLSVEADNVQTYQWQYSKDKGKTWNILRNSKVWEGNQAAELSFRATLSQDQMLIRCLVTNLAGTASSKPVQLTVLFGSSD